jgi:hypothetical protein
MTLKIYDLYPGGRRGFTNQSVEYRGTVYHIAANSIKQAYWCAYNHHWISGPNETGIVVIYDRSRGYRLWDDCEGHEYAIPVRHGYGVRKINDAIREHQTTFHSLNVTA